MATYKFIDTELISIADAIRSKTGGTTSLAFPDGFCNALEEIISIPLAGPSISSLIDRTITRFTNNTITYLNAYAFAGCSNLSSVSIPKCQHIGSYAFYYCKSLTSIN